MTEVLQQIPISECGQLKVPASCEGCPVYELAKVSLSESQLNDTWVVEELSKRCPTNARMDLESLGVIDARNVVRERRDYFVQ